MARYQQQLDQYDWHEDPNYPTGLVKEYPDGFKIEIHDVGSYPRYGRYEWQVWRKNIQAISPKWNLLTYGYSPTSEQAKLDAERAVVAEQNIFATQPEAYRYRRPDCGCHVAAHRRSK